jgi:hypothetical protein
MRISWMCEQSAFVSSLCAFPRPSYKWSTCAQSQHMRIARICEPPCEASLGVHSPQVRIACEDSRRNHLNSTDGGALKVAVGFDEAIGSDGVVGSEGGCLF